MRRSAASDIYLARPNTEEPRTPNPELSAAVMRRATFHARWGLLLAWAATSAPSRAHDAALPPGVTLIDSSAERRLLAEAQTGPTDGQWLFEAALAAGGAGERALASHRASWQGWLASLRQATGAGNQRRQAKAVFDCLHRHVLRGGYQADCTDLASTLAGNGYNCVGATVLFNSLAEAIGLNVQAVETPEHVYSVVTTPAGPLEIEMTCRRWFAVIDDRAKRRALVEQTLGKPAPEPAAARRLSAAGLVALIYYNAGVDAIAGERFADAAQSNLKALRLDPANRLARGNLLATLNNWALQRARQRDYAGAVALLSHGRRIDRRHEPFQANLVALYNRWADDLRSRGRLADAEAVLARARGQLPEETSFERGLETPR